MDIERLEKQLRFIIEADKLKTVLRRTHLICDKEKFENDAEHSWHLTLEALLLFEYVVGKDKIDLFRVLKILIVHDLVEIGAGDTYCYDEIALRDKEQREKDAADSLYSLLPEDQKNEFLSLWEEYEEQQTQEAKYAAVIDRIQPLLQIYYTQGSTWLEHGINLKQELKRNEILRDIAPALWDYAKEIICESAKRGYLKDV